MCHLIKRNEVSFIAGAEMQRLLGYGQLVVRHVSQWTMELTGAKQRLEDRLASDNLGSWYSPPDQLTEGPHPQGRRTPAHRHTSHID